MWRDMRAALVLVSCLLAVGACSRDDAAERARLLHTQAARRLVGTWDATFVADARPGATHSASVRGMLAFTTDVHGPSFTAEMRGITHEGTYDLDFSPAGFTTGVADAPATAVARVVPGVGSDSLQVVLSPGTERFAVRMVGMLAWDSAFGTWNAYSRGAGGGSGRFVMRRRASSSADR
jgi:hypothetical protein